jgi:hypothetical protein
MYCFSCAKSHVRVPLNNFQSKTADKESHSAWSGRRKSHIKTEEGDDDHSVSIDISLVSYLSYNTVKNRQSYRREKNETAADFLFRCKSSKLHELLI